MERTKQAVDSGKTSRRIVHLTSVHPPFDTRIFHKECKSLAEAGYDVALIAPHERKEVVNSVRIMAVPRPRSRFHRMLGTARHVYRAALELDAKVFHFHDPELIPIGMLLKLRKKRVIYDAHEDFPRQILSKEWIPAPLRRPLAWVAEMVDGIAARVFDGIVAATPRISERFPKEKTVLVQNFPILDEFFEANTVPYSERPPWVVYVGGVSVIRGAREMLKAMELLPDKLGARLVLAGRFSPASLEKELRQFPGWTRVDFQGWLPRGKVADLLGKARAGLVLFHPEPNHVEAQPNKLFEYMAAGIPVIASDFPLWRKIVEGEGCGLLVNPLAPQEIAQAIHWVLTHPKEAEEMGRRGQQAVRKRYNWDVEAAKLLTLYERLSE